MPKSTFSFLLFFFFIGIFHNNTFAQVDILKEKKLYTFVDRMPCFEECDKKLKENNRKVPVQFDLPVRFSLDEMDRPKGNASAEDIVKTAVIVGGFLFVMKKIMDKDKKKNKRKN